MFLNENKEQVFTINWQNTLNEHIQQVGNFLQTNSLLANKYTNHKHDIGNVGFNIFTISSDIYFRENFHSDILKSLLDPSEKHEQLNLYLNIFIDLLNSIGNNTGIKKEDFKNAEVIRERYNIDILITDDFTKKAIIIENKINNAVDQPRQLPKYYERLKENYTVEAIVYLTLNTSKKPQKNDWTVQELVEIDPILKPIPSYDRKCTNLYTNWIIPSIIQSTNTDSLFILRQYGHLIKYLNSSTMDTISLEKFYNNLKEEDNLKTSISIRNMLNDLPEYMAIRIEDRYKDRCYPFKNVWRYQRRDTVFEEFTMENLYLKLDVWCGLDGYKIHFWNPKDDNYDMKKQLEEHITSTSAFEYDNGKINNIIRFFNFNEEEHLFNFIDELKVELKKLKGEQPVNEISLP